MPLDRRLRDEFQRTAALEPTTLSADALTTVEERVRGIRRNRRVAASVSALAVVVVALLVAVPHAGGTAGHVVPGTSLQPSPSRSSLDEASGTSVLDYTMSYPTGWAMTPAEKATGSDVFQSPTVQNVTVSSQTLATGQTEDQWVVDYLPGPGEVQRPDCFPPRTEWLPVDVGGHPGGLLGGDFGCNFTQAIVFVDQRVYIFTAVPDLPTGLFDQGLFNQMLASVRFGPAGESSPR